MSAYSKEYALGPKARAVAALQQLANDIQSGKVKMSGNEPKMTLRVVRSLRMSTDATFKELVAKFDKGQITVEQLKNKGRTLIEKKLPGPLRRTETDRIHHGTPLETGAILENMPPDQLYEYLVDAEKEGVYFGDSDQNTRGGSFDEREHTGARPKKSKSKTVYPNEFGPDGVTSMSGHPRGTRDPFYNIPDRPTTAVEAKKVLKPLLDQNAIDQDLARQVANPRRTFINNQLIEQGIIEPGVDIFSADIDDATLKKVAPVLKQPDMQRRVAESFKTPVKIENGVVRYNAVDPVAAAMEPLMKNRIGALTGVLFEGYNIDTIKKLEQGNLAGAGQDVAKGAAIGAGIEAGSKVLGAEKALGRVAAPVAGVSLFMEGREGSTTEYVLNNYGPNSQERPFWGTEFGEMGTEKPREVQAVENFIDTTGGLIRTTFNRLNQERANTGKNEQLVKPADHPTRHGFAAGGGM